jgi:hypothetical protein
VSLAVLSLTVRDLLEGPRAVNIVEASPSARAAVRAFDRRLRAVGYRSERLVPPSGSAEWWVPAADRPNAA